MIEVSLCVNTVWDYGVRNWFVEQKDSHLSQFPLQLLLRLPRPQRVLEAHLSLNRVVGSCGRERQLQLRWRQGQWLRWMRLLQLWRQWV